LARITCVGIQTDLLQLVIVPEGASIYESELAINHVLMIKNFVLAVPTLHQALSLASANLLRRVHENCRPELIQPVVDLIANVINDDVRYVKSPLDLRHQRTFAVKVRHRLLNSNGHLLILNANS
jgi:DNA mismatch repair protein MSH4